MQYCMIFKILFYTSLFKINFAKYVEGRIKTIEDWVFLARFCFLSGRGKYEYHIEFERSFGEPQLLLYYDDKSQWPSVYKSGKTCQQKLSVLSSIDNQIVTLSARGPYNFHSGCTLRTTSEEKENPNFEENTPITKIDNEINSTYFDRFLKTTIPPVVSFAEDNTTFLETFETINDTEFLNGSTNNLSFGTDIGFENKIENNTKYQEYAEDLFEDNNTQNNESKVRTKRNYQSFIVTCDSVGGFLTARERWWYIAISNCGNKNGIDLKYKFRMTNGPPGDFWHEHFSADEMYIPPILLAESLIYTILLLAIFVCAIELKTRHLFHCTYRLFGLSAFLQYFGVLFLGVAWSRYAVHGIGPHTTIGTVLQGASEIVFLALLLLMAKGYTITRARLSTCSTIKLTVFINAYIVFYISLFIYREEVFDPGEVLNLYESPAGLGLAGLRCGAWGAFLISITTTVKKFPEKANFFYPFGMLGSMWILGGPVLTFIGIAFFDPWVRESVMLGVLAALSISGHASFLWLTWPSRANYSFPYHVRTNHVGVMSVEDDGADYPRHVYEPTLTTDQNIIIPLSQRTEDMLSGVYNKYLQERDLYNSSSTPHSHVSYPSTAHDQTPISYPKQPQYKNDNINLKENENDSGHPSIDEPQTAPINIQNTTPKCQQLNCSTVLENTLKKNPFIINGIDCPPNKIILEPITNGNNNISNEVPRHLFAAKNPKTSSILL